VIIVARIHRPYARVYRCIGNVEDDHGYRSPHRLLEMILSAAQ
jgi:hypothetical protein